MSENDPKHKYYSKENPSGLWSRGLFRMRTGRVAGKPFDEEEFREGHDDGELPREL